MPCHSQSVPLSFFAESRLLIKSKKMLFHSFDLTLLAPSEALIAIPTYYLLLPYRYCKSTFGVNKQILQGNSLPSGKNYTARKITKRPPVATFVTNFKSDCSRPHSYPGEQRQDLLDGCRHVYLDMGTNAGVQT